jgi:hypothetical protein
VNTIFPALLHQHHGADRLTQRYVTEIYPCVKRHPDWQWGTYAQRLLHLIQLSPESPRHRVRFFAPELTPIHIELFRVGQD